MYAADTLKLQRVFAELPDRTQMRILKPAMGRAAQIVAAAEKSEAPKETGLMETSLGASATRTYNASGGSTKLFIAVGVRRGYRRAVVPKARGGLRYLGRAASVAAEANDDANMRNPEKYLHLITGGRKAVMASNRKVLYSALSGRFLGKSVAEADPNPFMDRAFDAASGQAAGEVLSVCAPAIETEAVALGK